MNNRHIILLLFALLLAPLAALPAAESAKFPAKPNILFAIADDWSYGHAGAYGCKWIKTPAMDRVARDGILFTQAYTPNGKCSPSRASIITGRNPWQLKAAGNHWSIFPPEFKSYRGVLGQQGYFAGMTGKGWGPGIATNAAGQNREMAGKPFNARRLPAKPAKGISPADYAGNFNAFLDAVPQGKPWSFWYGVLLAKERNDVGRPNDEGYPIRGIVTGDMLYLHNFETNRWPGGLAETGYKDTDDSPTKTAVLETEKIPALKHFFDASFGKLPADQLFDLRRDPDCMTNLATTVSFAALQAQLFDELKQQGDPRMLGNGHIYDEYPYGNASMRNYYDRVMRGEKFTTDKAKE